MIRTIVYLPAIISPLIIGYIWSIILSSENGVLLECMKMLGLEAFFRDLLADPSSALCVIIVVHVWQYLGGNMIIYLAGLQNIPGDLLESARMDGAGGGKQILRIKLPLLGPLLSDQYRDQHHRRHVHVRCDHVPYQWGTRALYGVSERIYLSPERLQPGGYTAAVSMIMFIIVLIPAGTAFWMMRKMNVEM